MSLYLNEYEELVKNGVVYLPVGTIEWHGRQLPIETDFLVAEKICQILAKDFPGLVLPSLYLGTCSAEVIDGVEMRGMDRKLKKELLGNLFFLKPELFKELLEAVVYNLRQQGFKKIIILTGHGGPTQLETLNGLAKNQNDILFIDPYEFTEVNIHHADKGETSLLWSLCPEEEDKSKAQNIPADDDLNTYRGYMVRDESSVDLGNKHLEEILNSSKKKIDSFLKN